MLLALEKIGYDPYEFQRHLATRRFDIDIEWKVRKYLRSETLGEAVELLSDAFDWFEKLKKASMEELIAKGWIKKSDLEFVGRLEERLVKLKR